MTIELKQKLFDHIQNFSKKPLRQAALDFFSGLGYQSSRTLEIASVDDFCEEFDVEGHLQHPRALLSKWKQVELLFQLTDEDLSSAQSLFKDDSVHRSVMQSYVFFAVKLQPRDYARGKLADITRRINRVFPMPVLVLFKIDDRLSLAIINRRYHKRDKSRDVLGKVTLIQNINIHQPHRGHLDILSSLALETLETGRRNITSFDQLHTAWAEIFNIELLNQRFYEELSNWYFWARRQVSFPDDLESDELERNSTGIIRLLTRLIFCWFLKEKNFIPDALFDESKLAQILNDLEPDSGSYHQAILQNLFFATLNQRMNLPGEKPARKFAQNQSFHHIQKEYV